MTMFVIGALWMIIGLQAPALSGDSTARTSRLPRADTTVTTDSVRDVRLAFPIAVADTPHARPKVIEVSDWYDRRLRVHGYVAYATVPVFAWQWAAGDQLV